MIKRYREISNVLPFLVIIPLVLDSILSGCSYKVRALCLAIGCGSIGCVAGYMVVLYRKLPKKIQKEYGLFSGPGLLGVHPYCTVALFIFITIILIVQLF